MNERHSSFDFAKESELTIGRREFLFSFFYLVGGVYLNKFKKKAVIPEFKVYMPVVTSVSQPSVSVCGICYGPYRDGQNPDTGPHPDEDEFREDIPLLAAIANAVRFYGTENNLEKLPGIIQKEGPNLAINAGAWLGKDLEANERQLANLIALARNYPNIGSVTVGSEVLLRQDLSETELAAYIRRVRSAVDCPVTTAETWWNWLNHRNLATEVDFIFAHFFPYWEPSPLSVGQAVPFIKQKYQELKSKYQDKNIVIGETGWPSAGETRGPAVPSIDNQKTFIDELLAWLRPGNVDFYYYDAFDEKWKKKHEGEVGGHWGLYYSDRTPKHPGLKLK